jgi:hypothetical protein
MNNNSPDERATNRGASRSGASGSRVVVRSSSRQIPKTFSADSCPRRLDSSEDPVRPWLVISVFIVVVLAIGSMMLLSRDERSRHTPEAVSNPIQSQENTGSPTDELPLLSLKEGLPQSVSGTAANTSAERADSESGAGDRANSDDLATLLKELQNTNEPFEFAKLAQRVDKLAPGQFSEQIVLAARALLAKAGNESFGDKDVAPIFEVLQHYGRESVVLDLEQAAGKWQYYSAIALAQLPNDAGIPALIRMAQAEGSTTLQSAALRLITQVSAQNELARDFLMDQAQQDRIPSDSWITLAPVLRGDQLRYQDSAFNAPVNALDLPGSKIDYVATGNQSFSTAPASATLNSQDLPHRIDLLKQLLSVVRDPVAIEALQRSLDLLASQTLWASFLSN